MSYFKNRIAVVTGAGRGIGAATAELLVERGAKVALLSRTQSELDSVARVIESRFGSGKTLTVPTDLSDPQSIVQAFETVKKTWGPASLLVNNAGMIRVQELEKTSLSDWDQTFSVNVRAPHLCSQQLFAHVRSLGGVKFGGAIVNLSSLGGLRGTQKFKGFGSYSTSKFAVVGLTECLAVEGKELGIRANCVAPGAVSTKMLKDAAPFLSTSTQPSDVAKVIAYLLNAEESSKVSGTVIEIFSNE